MPPPSVAPSSTVTGPDPARLQATADEASAFLRSMANRDRLMLLCTMMQDEQCVGDLELATGIRQPTLSQQLSVLRSQGLVETRREGKFVHYRVASDRAVQLLELLYGLFCGPAAVDGASKADRPR